MFDLPSFTWLFVKDTAKLSKGSAWSFTPEAARTQGYRFSSANQLTTTLKRVPGVMIILGPFRPYRRLDRMSIVCAG
jgi:hypothetical protein